MTETKELTYEGFVLPPSVISRVEVSHLVDEAERIDNELTTAAVHAKAGAETSASFTISEQMTEFLTLNRLDFKNARTRAAAIKQMHLLKDKVPVIHMTFAVEADRESVAQLVAWLRQQVHKQAVVAIGLQPALVAGVYLRTPNHVHDLSLRAKIESSRGLLVKELEALRG